MSDLTKMAEELAATTDLLKEAADENIQLRKTAAAFERHLKAEEIAQKMVDRGMIAVEKYASTVQSLDQSNQDLASIESGLSFVNSQGFDVGETVDQGSTSAPSPVSEKTAGNRGTGAPRHIVADRSAAAASLLNQSA